MVSWWQLSQGLSTSLATRLRRRRLEGFKFSVYVLLPIGASYFFGSGAYPYLERIIQQVRFRAFSSSLGFFFLFLALVLFIPAASPLVRSASTSESVCSDDVCGSPGSTYVLLHATVAAPLDYLRMFTD